MAKLRVVKLANIIDANKLINLIKAHREDNLISTGDNPSHLYVVLQHDDRSLALIPKELTACKASTITSADLEALSLVSGEVFTELLFSL